MIYYLQLLAAFVLDGLIGDPRWYPHPVRGIGWLICWSERITRSKTDNLYLAGLMTVVAVIGITVGIVSLVLCAAAAFSSTIAGFAAVLLLYTTIAARDLLRHSNTVYLHLEEDFSLDNARNAVGMIVGRDTSRLNEDGICRATIETVAENMVDGITAPFFFAVVAGCFAPALQLSPIACSAVGAFFYKAVNTMDSMIGYKNEQYLQFGRVAAKLDDVVNFIPARLSGVCVIIAAFFLKLDYRGAAKVFMTDRLHHSSPNAGHTEAATAGALGVRLGGPSVYFNKVVEKPYMGATCCEPVPEDIKKTNRLVIVGSIIFFIFVAGVRFIFI